jgi:GntR family transcriptional regulator, transcriptional repressor for pyruvate dehydrogenase complex
VVENNDMFVSLKPKRLSDSAVDQILSLVRQGNLAPGSKLPPERELITRLSVSRTSLREAIRILETMGVLRVVPGRGTWVRDDYAEPSLGANLAWLPGQRDDIIQIFEMRETLEVRAASLAAERGTAEGLAAIEAAVKRYERAMNSGETDQLAETDRAVHESIAGASGNKYLMQVLDSVHDLVQDIRQAMVFIPGRPQRIAKEHQPVLEAILAHDAAAAARAMSHHVRNAEEEIRAATSLESHLT